MFPERLHLSLYILFYSHKSYDHQGWRILFGGMDWKIFPWQQVQVQALLRILPPRPAAGQSPAGALATCPRPLPSTALCDLNRTSANSASARLPLITNTCRYSALFQIKALTTPGANSRFAPESIEWLIEGQLLWASSITFDNNTGPGRVWLVKSWLST